MPKTPFSGCVHVSWEFETYGFAVENVDINSYIGFLEVLICHGN